MQIPLGVLLSALQVSHRHELTQLAVIADEIAAQSSFGGPRTSTPGTDALATMYPHLVHDFRRADGPAVGFFVPDPPGPKALR